jgi:hypothetical protein
VQQSYQNARARRGLEYEGIIGGSDSFTIIGSSGIGKSSAISRAISVISASGIIEVDEPYTRIIPSLTVQCPFDASVKAKQLRLVILNSITVDCRDGKIDPMSQAFIQMSGVFSELELSMIRERVRSGMENAKAKGKHVGRRPTTREDIPPIFYKHYPTYMAGQINVSEFARLCGMSRPTIYKYLCLFK